MKNLCEYAAGRYAEYQENFLHDIENASSVSEMLHVYASYTGRLEALLDGISIEVGDKK